MIHLPGHDTIAAISSPPGEGVRGIVRLSGPEAVAISGAVFEPIGEVGAGPSRGRITVSGVRRTLPAMRLRWPAGRSYTGEELVELHLDGVAPFLSVVLGALISSGARMAEPGEFTLRAFLSGRLELTQAEAVLAVIDARSRPRAEEALRQLAGGLSRPIQGLRDRLLDVLAHLEAGLDFVDEADVDPLGRAALADEIRAGAEELADLAQKLGDRDRPARRPQVVLVGPPNAGKSRLFNALVREDHALVSPIAGTTRDYLIADCDCDGLIVELIDTAGREEAGGEIEARAQALRDDRETEADLVIDCLSVDAGPRTSGIDGPGRARLLVRTKGDLLDGVPRPSAELLTSALDGMGLGELRARLACSLRADGPGEDLATLTGARCRGALERAASALGSAAEAILAGAGDELVAVDLRSALDELGRVVGAIVTDDILDRIFRRFCIGK